MKKRLPLSNETILNGRYKILGILGSGGMGNVYEALNLPVSAIVALKETFAEDDYSRRLFEREAKLLANLNHDSFPRVSDHFIDGDGQYLIMEMITGPDLDEMLDARQAAFPYETVLDWTDQILEALEDLHAEGIYHRDIKPANLKPTRRNKIKILDFGVAKGITGDMSTMKLSTNIGGTIAFAPLEQVIKMRPEWHMTLSAINSDKATELMDCKTDARTDIYALGTTLYQLLTNRLPEIAPARAINVWTGKADPLRPVSEFNKEIPPKIIEILNKAMALDRQDRYASAKEMKEALREARKPVKIIEPVTVKTKPLLTPEDYVERADKHLKNGEYDKAIALCDIAIEHNKDLALAYGVRGTVYQRKGEYDKAIEDYDKVTELDPNYSTAYYNRGLAYRNKGKYDMAIEDYSKAIELNPKDQYAYHNRGISYSKRGEYDKAIEDYTKAIELDPKYQSAYINRGNSYGYKVEIDKAIEDYTKVIELNPKYQFSYSLRGIAYEYKGEYDKAIEDYTKAIELDPKYQSAYIYRALAYDKIGETAKAGADRQKTKELEEKQQ